MRWAELAAKLLELAEVVHRWMAALSDLEPERRRRVARYAEAIADTLARAAEALEAYQKAQTGLERRKARSRALAEIGRLNGYVATIVDVLRHRLDGRRLAGVKRRLESLDARRLGYLRPLTPTESHLRIDRLHAAEGYFRALADGLRV